MLVDFTRFICVQLQCTQPEEHLIITSENFNFDKDKNQTNDKHILLLDFSLAIYLAEIGKERISCPTHSTSTTMHVSYFCSVTEVKLTCEQLI